MKSGLRFHKELYRIECESYYECIFKAKSTYLKNLIADADTKTLFGLVKSLSSPHHSPILPDHSSDCELANRFAKFFVEKVSDVVSAFSDSSSAPATTSPVGPPQCNFSEFRPVTDLEVKKLITSLPSKHCQLDPIPTLLLKDTLRDILPLITKLFNFSLSSGLFPEPFKSSLLLPLLKKPALDPNSLNNYRPIANLPFWIEILRHTEDLSERPSASRAFAQFIDKMNHLENLTLYGWYHDEFYSTSSSIASFTKIETLHDRCETLHDRCENLSERPSASRDFAQFICKMNHLKNLTLYGRYHNEFYSTSSSMASTTKIEILSHGENLRERPSASRDFAQFICKMNHLKTLTLSGSYHDDFYSTSLSMASTTQIETLWHRENLRERPSASRDFAQFICKMNHLKNLTLRGSYHDDFYVTSSSMASTTKIETLLHDEDLSVRPSASRDFAQFICKMNHLKNLRLYCQYHDDFYVTSSSRASTTQIETLWHDEDLSKRPSASRDFAQFICKMNHLKNLRLYCQYHDDFYVTSSSMASTTKIDQIDLWHDEDLSKRPSASRDFAQFICKMNHLKNLTLRGSYHDDFYVTSSSMASTTKPPPPYKFECLSGSGTDGGKGYQGGAQ
ncbi:uncharacterized protein LOC121413174 [Lytechinus variegatus]|uniref:uncharacterized protein LOC121413174 n=1 Tax=Lytechinus variegatus TaxID=7654 RepID=UPI001BB1009E|nr:uncharacterized protein LOC121413174 [Lytechinus variegatus]